MHRVVALLALASSVFPQSAKKLELAIHSNPPGPGDQTPGALDQGPTLILAVQEQLGLRLESKKGMVDFVVVDHVEKIPAGN